MKIYADRRSDLIQRRKELDDRNFQHTSEYNDYKEARNVQMSKLQENVERLIGNYDLIELEVRIDIGFNGYEIRILCDENRKFSDNSALSWSITIQLDENGEVVKESSSWSGLKATTTEQIASLEQSLMAIKRINNLDWKVILNIKEVDMRDYIVTPNVRQSDYDDIDVELLKMDLEDAVGTNQAIPTHMNGKYYRVPVYLVLLDASPSQYTVFEIPETRINDDWDRFAGDTYKIRKSTLLNNIDKSKEWVKR